MRACRPAVRSPRPEHAGEREAGKRHRDRVEESEEAQQDGDHAKESPRDHDRDRERFDRLAVMLLSMRADEHAAHDRKWS